MALPFPLRSRAVLTLGLFTLTGFLAILVCGAMVRYSARGRLYESAADTPARRTGLVLGCAKTLGNGRKNWFFELRMRAAADLYHAGKIQRILVSGDNSRKTYDEPSDMKEDLIRRGVPEAHIHCDYAGFRTLDSVVRAKEVFGQTQFTVVSQRFHNERAIFLARSRGVDAIGYNAKDVRRSRAVKTYLREKLARVKTVLDVYLLRTQPKFLGDPVNIH
ncbi:MAG: ElyC/SanA/YdcF family protein [Verrucomicrobiota bacterium]